MENDELFEINELINYKITKSGKIWSIKNNRFLKPRICNGYRTITLKNNTINITIHRIVAKTFILNPENKPYVNHINNNKLDNRLENLEWVTQKENCAAHQKNISHPRKVIQMDMNDNIISRFDSIKEASKTIGYTAASISRVVLGINKTAGGYKWKYDSIYKNELDTTNAVPIYGNTNYYIFSDGTVYNIIRKSILKPVKNAAGYAYVTICNNREKKNHYIHRIVAHHFIKNTDETKIEVNHKNKKRDDNKVENLEWVTHSENQLHANASVLNL